MLQLAVAIGIGGAVYFTITYFLGFREFQFPIFQKLLGYFTGGLNGQKR
jgi:hypothetical protein